MNNTSLFCNRLKHERKKSGLTQAELAEKCNVSREMWGKYERGESMPGSEVLLSFSQLGADMQFLFTGTKNERGRAQTSDEQELLAEYRQATDASKKIILTIARTQEKKEKGIENRQIG